MAELGGRSPLGLLRLRIRTPKLFFLEYYKKSICSNCMLKNSNKAVEKCVPKRFFLLWRESNPGPLHIMYIPYHSIKISMQQILCILQLYICYILEFLTLTITKWPKCWFWWTLSHIKAEMTSETSCHPRFHTPGQPPHSKNSPPPLSIGKFKALKRHGNILCSRQKVCMLYELNQHILHDIRGHSQVFFEGVPIAVLR